jgi:hypothetical protein
MINVKRPKPIPLKPLGRGRHILPIAKDFVSLVPPQGTEPGQLLFRVGVRQELVVPLTREAYEALTTRLLGLSGTSSIKA